MGCVAAGALIDYIGKISGIAKDVMLDIDMEIRSCVFVRRKSVLIAMLWNNLLDLRYSRG